MVVLSFQAKQNVELICAALDRSHYKPKTLMGCFHGWEAFGGVNNSIAILIKEQVKRHNRPRLEMGDVMIDGFNAGVFKDADVWLAASKPGLYEVLLTRGDRSVSLPGFLNAAATSFVFELLSDESVCERAFANGLMADIGLGCGENKYSLFLRDAIRDTLSMSKRDAVRECRELLKMLKLRVK